MSIDEAKTEILPAFRRDEEFEELVSDSHGGSTPETVLAALRQRREQLAAERHYDLEVPGYGGLLALRLKPIGATLWTKLADRVTKSSSPERNFNLNADTLIATCSMVIVRAKASDDFQPLDVGEGPIRLDDQLSQALDLNATTARDVVRKLFGLANSPEVAVATLVGTYVEWCQEANSDVEEQLLGEA